MRYVNKAIIIGNVTRDAEAKQTDKAVMSCFSVATNREWNNSNGEKQSLVEYHDIVAWGFLADYCNDNIKKGKLVYVEGYIKTRSWEEDDGTKKFRTEIVAQEVSILSKKEEVHQDTDIEEDNNLDGDPAVELE